MHLVISCKGLSSASRLAASQPQVSWESDKELLAGAGPSLPRSLPGKMPAGCQGDSNSGMTQCFHDLPSHFAWTGWYVGPTCGNMCLFLLQFQEGKSLLRGIFRRFCHGNLAIAPTISPSPQLAVWMFLSYPNFLFFSFLFFFFGHVSCGILVP